MFEYHGWITVRETAVDDDDDVRPGQIVDELRLHIAQMASPCLVDRRWMNGAMRMRYVFGRLARGTVTQHTERRCLRAFPLHGWGVEG
ncbi:Imm7 family immunity protein [Streptomyces mirabilis]|uniref:Imm7 family immunity protein n=1 Tax=Streptomyces mirabilis TaxID=68239 RepID=UPI000D1B8A3D|nr:Imm7 family immunity protein [Streptomyces mirabilis]